MRSCLLFCWLVFGLLLNAPVVSADNTRLYSSSDLQLNSSHERVRLNPYFKIISNAEPNLSLQQVMDAPQLFKWPKGNSTSYGYSPKPIWLHASVSNFTDTRRWVLDIDFPHLEEVTFYFVVNGELISSTEQGKFNQAKQFRLPSARIELPFATSVDLYIRVSSQATAIVVPIDIQSEANFAKMQLNDTLGWGMFYGGLLVLILYNLFHSRGKQSKVQFAFVLYATSLILWRFVWGGHVILYLPVEMSLYLDNNRHLLLVLLAITSGIFSLSFVNGRKTAPQSTPAILICIVIAVLIGLLSVFQIFSGRLAVNSALTALVLVFASSFFAALESHLNQAKSARLFIWGWSIFGLGAFSSLLILLNVIAPSWAAAYAFAICAFVQACLFALALMQKSRLLLQDEIQQRSLELRSNMELVEEQNVRLDIARKEALTASNVKSQFLASMSHEIRTPLNVILGFSEELNKSSIQGEEKEQLMLIHSAANTLLGTVNDVLDLSKIEAGQLKLTNEGFKPGKLLEEIVTMMSRSAQAKGLEFIFELDVLPEKFLGDAFRIKQVLNNLLSNAVKFTPKGHIRFSVRSESISENLCELIMEVEDSGIGISREDRKKLFRAFSQVDASATRRYQGTGLGLVISQELVHTMHGKISLDSQPGKGSCFTVHIPITPVSQHLFPAPSEDWQGKRVALYDPIPDSMLASRKLLEALGAQVSSADTLRELDKLTGAADFLMAAIPLSHSINRQELLAMLSEFAAESRFLLYSGSRPLDAFPAFSQYFDAQVRLPLTVGRLKNLQSTTTQNPYQQPEQILSSLPSIAVLAVDDSPMNLHLLKTWLNNSPVELTCLHSGEEAVARCHQQEFDLILMDVNMPVMDGVTASQLIRQTALNPGTPIIAVTADSDRDQAERLLASGMDDYQAKPLNFQDLVRLINLWCAPASSKGELSLSVDWQLAIQQANHAEGAAEELLIQLVDQLPQFIDNIHYHWQQQALPALQREVHKLHGACHYTGVPKLRVTCENLEIALKQNCAQESQVRQLIDEAKQVIHSGSEILNDLESNR